MWLQCDAHVNVVELVSPFCGVCLDSYNTAEREHVCEIFACLRQCVEDGHMTNCGLAKLFVFACRMLLLTRAALPPSLLLVQFILVGGYASAIDGCTTRVIAHCRLLGW